MDNSYCTDNVLDSKVDTYSCGETTLCDVDPCVIDHIATSGHKQEDVDPTTGQNQTIDPIVHTGTLECVDVDESDSDSIASSEETVKCTVKFFYKAIRLGMITAGIQVFDTQHRTHF